MPLKKLQIEVSSGLSVPTMRPVDEFRTLQSLGQVLKSSYRGGNMSKPTFQEIEKRLKTLSCQAAFDERHACCWQGYLAALLEWDLISPDDHKNLTDIIPVAEVPNPTLSIFLGKIDP